MRLINRKIKAAGVAGVGATLAAVVALGAGAGTAAVAAAPQNTSPPTIKGTAQEGKKLVGSRGTWTGGVTDYTDHWQRCDDNGGSCANIGGATDGAAGYVLKKVDVGNRSGSASRPQTPTAAPAQRPCRQP